MRMSELEIHVYLKWGFGGSGLLEVIRDEHVEKISVPKMGIWDVRSNT